MRVNANLITQFREKLQNDLENLNARRNFHEQYEWLEAYWSDNFKHNEIEKFSNKFFDYFWEIDEFRNLARRLSSYSPVGNSNLKFDPTPDILRATFHLRYYADLFDGEFPEIENNKDVGFLWKRNSLNAVLVVIKQIRDNLFHGKKM